MPSGVQLFFTKGPGMRNNQSDLIGYGIVSIIAAMIIYNFWHWLVGALAIFGFCFIVNEYHKNNRR